MGSRYVVRRWARDNDWRNPRKMGSNYLWSDAWLLFGVVIDSAKETRALAVSQADIIAAADFIAHDIMSFEQMEGAFEQTEGALARLTVGGQFDRTQRRVRAL